MFITVSDSEHKQRKVKRFFLVQYVNEYSLKYIQDNEGKASILMEKPIPDKIKHSKKWLIFSKRKKKFSKKN